jgi:hypothetical protein
MLQTLGLAEHVEREPWFRHEHRPFGKAFRQRKARGHDDADFRVALRGEMRELHAVNLAGQLHEAGFLDSSRWPDLGTTPPHCAASGFRLQC